MPNQVISAVRTDNKHLRTYIYVYRTVVMKVIYRKITFISGTE